MCCCTFFLNFSLSNSFFKFFPLIYLNSAKFFAASPNYAVTLFVFFSLPTFLSLFLCSHSVEVLVNTPFECSPKLLLPREVQLMPTLHSHHPDLFPEPCSRESGWNRVQHSVIRPAKRAYPVVPTYIFPYI